MRRVSGLDVHKDSVFLCIVDDDGVVFQSKYGVLTPELEQMAGVMVDYGVEEAAMESTSIYWMPVWRVLEPYFSLRLVNPFFIKQLPGKKSDVKDAEWIATCLQKELIKGSYVPDELIQQLRQYDRRIFDLSKDIVYKLTKLDAALQRCNIRISNYISTTKGKAYQAVYSNNERKMRPNATRFSGTRPNATKEKVVSLCLINQEFIEELKWLTTD